MEQGTRNVQEEVEIFPIYERMSLPEAERLNEELRMNRSGNMGNDISMDSCPMPMNEDMCRDNKRMMKRRMPAGDEMILPMKHEERGYEMPSRDWDQIKVIRPCRKRNCDD